MFFRCFVVIGIAVLLWRVDGIIELQFEHPAIHASLRASMALKSNRVRNHMTPSRILNAQ